MLKAFATEEHANIDQRPARTSNGSYGVNEQSHSSVSQGGFTSINSLLTQLPMSKHHVIRFEGRSRKQKNRVKLPFCLISYGPDHEGVWESGGIAPPFLSPRYPMDG
jgi:hypothetical protein